MIPYNFKHRDISRKDLMGLYPMTEEVLTTTIGGNVSAVKRQPYSQRYKAAECESEWIAKRVTDEARERQNVLMKKITLLTVHSDRIKNKGDCWGKKFKMLEAIRLEKIEHNINVRERVCY